MIGQGKERWSETGPEKETEEMGLKEKRWKKMELKHMIWRNHKLCGVSYLGNRVV